MVAPGSLDYLYYNGILDRIPYEAYETIQTPAPHYINNQMPYDSYHPLHQPQNIQKSRTQIPTWLKGLASVGVLIATVCCLFKGKNVPAQQAGNVAKSSFWSKLNPVNWFKR